MNEPTIHIENLSIGYASKHSVKTVATGISADICGGELTCLLGANGVGKSTLLRTLSAFQPKLDGNIYVQGKEIDAYTDKQLSRVLSVVLTEKCDIRNMTATELVGPLHRLLGNPVEGRQGGGGPFHRPGGHRTPGRPHGGHPERR